MKFPTPPSPPWRTKGCPEAGVANVWLGTVLEMHWSDQPAKGKGCLSIPKMPCHQPGAGHPLHPIPLLEVRIYVFCCWWWLVGLFFMINTRTGSRLISFPFLLSLLWQHHPLNHCPSLWKRVCFCPVCHLPLQGHPPITCTSTQSLATEAPEMGTSAATLSRKSWPHGETFATW